MTNLQITMLLHYAAIAKPYAWNDPEHANSTAVREQRLQLVQNNMLDEVHSADEGYKLTPRGHCFVDYIQTLPLPIQSYKMIVPVP